MPDHKPLSDAIRLDNIQEARTLLKNADNIPGSIEELGRIQIYDRLIRAKAFDIILLFVEYRLIQTDLYEYDTLNDTVFESMVRNLQPDEESLQFTDSFLSKLDNINDAINGQTLLGLAFIEKADVAVIQRMIKAGCDVNYVNNAEETYLHQIAKNQLLPPDKAIAYTQLLIDEGLDVNANDITKKTPLIVAMYSNKKDVVDMMLQNGASCNEPDQQGETAYYHAVVHLQNPAMYEKLKAYELPDLSLANSRGETMLFEFLRRLSRPTETTLKFLSFLIEDGASPLQPSVYYSQNQLPLDLAAGHSFDVFGILVNAPDVDINAADNAGNTLLHKVCKATTGSEDAGRDTYKKVKLLLEKGADVSVVNNLDETALMLASNDNFKSKTVQLLLSQK